MTACSGRSCATRSRSRGRSEAPASRSSSSRPVLRRDRSLVGGGDLPRVPDGEPFRWSASLDPEDAAELERLRADGHVVTRDRRGHRVEPSPASIRETQLHRTLLHELGHHVDWLRGQARARTRRAKEDFAHRYAAETRERVPRLSTPLVDVKAMKAEGLDPGWFQAP